MKKQRAKVTSNGRVAATDRCKELSWSATGAILAQQLVGILPREACLCWGPAHEQRDSGGAAAVPLAAVNVAQAGAVAVTF